MNSINYVQPKSIFLKCFVCWRPRGPQPIVWDDPLIPSEFLGAMASLAAKVPNVESVSTTSRGSTFAPGQVRVLPYELPPFKIGMIKTDLLERRCSFFLRKRAPLFHTSSCHKNLLTFNITYWLRSYTLKWDDHKRDWPTPHTSTKTIPFSDTWDCHACFMRSPWEFKKALEPPERNVHWKFWRKAFHPGISKKT